MGCDLCHYKCFKTANLKKHFATKKHQENVKNRESSVRLFQCQTCHYQCDKRANYDRHLRTQKHVATTHIEADHTPEDTPRMELLMCIIRQNEELKTMLLEERQKIQEQNALIQEYCREPRTTVHNKNQFNMNFFLNVQCKDALNMSEFMNNLEIQVEDVENVGKLGFVEGISRIIMNGLKDLELHKRPIHCMDAKRDVMYVKDEDRWQKDEEHARIRQVIETVEQRNCQRLCSEMKPDEDTANDSSIEKYMEILKEVNGGGSRDKKHEKIIKTLSRNLVVDRSP